MLFELFHKSQHLRYSKAFENLFERFVPPQGKGLTEQERTYKIFSNKYEFYIFAFFIGYHLKSKYDIKDEEGKTFWQFSDWPKHNDYKKIIFMLLLKNSLDDFYKLEQMTEDELRQLSNRMFKEVEEYANKGLEYINERRKKEPEYFFNTFWPKDILEECINNP